MNSRKLITMIILTLNENFEFSRFDLIIGESAIDVINSTFFAPTEFYMQDEITWCVARAQPISKWCSIFAIVRNIETHILIYSTTILVIIITFLLSTFERCPFDAWKSVIYVFQLILVGYGTSPRRTLSKIIVTYFAFILLICYTIFNAFFINFMTGVALTKQINTFDELKIENFHFASQSSAMKYLNRTNLVRCFLKLSSKIS